ncbi:uncharacterized protein LOC118436763 [Folsomia candida]|uniref:uncharacterized protein LOC118436763 n=1 Tax=Folsomia candida TaxID=158441 RepID=UPI0016054490|nr:uncharacterized protein LOC118436763 [Folsomia candida]
MELSLPFPRPHLAVTLPEIVREIVSFLPNHDLRENVTRVSRRWEDAARKRLISRVCVTLTPKNMAGYLEQTNIRGNHHKCVFLSEFNFEDLSHEESNLLENFTYRATPLITELHLDYFPHELFIHPHVATLFSHCPKLEFVSFSPKTFRIPTMKSSLSSGVSFPTVRKFKIGYNSGIDAVLKTLSATNFLQIVSIFPNLKILRGETLPQHVLEYFLSNKGSIETISMILHDTHFDRKTIPVSD